MPRKTYFLLLLYLSLAPAIAQAQELEISPPLAETTLSDEAPTAAAPWDGHRVYADVEYVLWWLREGRLPPTLTTSSTASQGLLGEPDTRVLYGGDRLETRHGDRFNGLRFTLGGWFNSEQTIGVEGRAVFLERDSTFFKATSDGSQLLARPFIDAVNGSPMSEIIAGTAPDDSQTSGGFVGFSKLQLFTQEVNLVRVLFQTPQFGLNLLAGARFAQIHERTDLMSSGSLLPEGSTIFGLDDRYRVHDYFYGGQLGLSGHYLWNRWWLGFRATAAVGGNAEQVVTFGDRLVATPSSRMDSPFGLTVLPTNAGTADRTAVNGIYEVDLNVGYRLTDHWKAFVGYSLFLWSSPIRSGDQVDLDINPSQITGPLVGTAQPVIPFKDDFFWAQGLNVGLTFSW